MKVFGDTVYDAKNKIFVKQLKPTAWYIDVYNYMIDWKTRKKVHLVNWLKNQLVESDSVLTNILLEFNLLGDTDDETILNILRWVKDYYVYVGDVETYDAKEYWATFKESFNLRVGDCEDGAIAVFLLARTAGIQPEKVKIACGNVVGGGHAYVLYTADDGMQYPIDWCYWTKLYGFERRKSIWEEPNYLFGKDIWFGVNDIEGFK